MTIPSFNYHLSTVNLGLRRLLGLYYLWFLAVWVAGLLFRLLLLVTIAVLVGAVISVTVTTAITAVVASLAASGLRLPAVIVMLAGCLLCSKVWLKRVLFHHWYLLGGNLIYIL